MINNVKGEKMGWAFLISLFISISVVNNDYLYATHKGFCFFTIVLTIVLGITWLVS